MVYFSGECAENAIHQEDICEGCGRSTASRRPPGSSDSQSEDRSAATVAADREAQQAGRPPAERNVVVLDVRPRRDRQRSHGRGVVGDQHPQKPEDKPDHSERGQAGTGDGDRVSPGAELAIWEGPVSDRGVDESRPEQDDEEHQAEQA